MIKMAQDDSDSQMKHMYHGILHGWIIGLDIQI